MQARLNHPSTIVAGTAATAWRAIIAHRRSIAYWLVSAPVLLETAAGAQWDLAQTPYVREVMQHLGYPLYFLTIMGVAKVLALAALLAPRFVRLKEWAYAGLFFVYVGAASSHFAAHDPPALVVVPAVFAAITLASWALRPPSRRMPGSRG
jgi:DoxX-like family